MPQLRSAIVMAPFEYAVMGRGTGKTKGILARKSAAYLDMMPRCVGVFVASTFQQQLTRTLPPLIAGWKSLGYIEDVHFVVFKKPTAEWRKQWDWQGPYHMPLDFSYFISWWNGAGVQLISQDRAGGSNGVSIDWIMGDECKLLNPTRLTEELFPANRGLYKHLANNPHHHGITFTTDMPIGTAGRWILSKENEMDPVKLRDILVIEKFINEYNFKLLSTRNVALQNSLRNKIAKLQNAANAIRHNFTLFHTGSALQNIHSLGVDYINTLIRDLSNFEFRTAVLNHPPIKLEDGFYPHLDEDVHGYFSYDYQHTFEKHGYNLDAIANVNDCRKDGDVNTDEPLHIGMDYNRRIWPIVTAQPIINSTGKCLRVLSGIDVLYPLSLQDALVKWTNYYAFHKRKTVYFWYDHTALIETRQTHKDEIVTTLRGLGWVVIEVYIGQTYEQSARYVQINKILNAESDWRISINRDNCKYLLLSMYQCQAIEKEKGYGKDKRTEKDKNFPAREAPHYSDALDTLVVGVCLKNLIEYKGDDYTPFQVRS